PRDGAGVGGTCGRRLVGAGSDLRTPDPAGAVDAAARDGRRHAATRDGRSNAAGRRGTAVMTTIAPPALPPARSPASPERRAGTAVGRDRDARADRGVRRRGDGDRRDRAVDRPPIERRARRDRGGPRRDRRGPVRGWLRDQTRWVRGLPAHAERVLGGLVLRV